MRAIAHGHRARVQSEERQAVAVRTERDYAAQWDALIGYGERPQVDFSKESVVFLLAGMRPTGGYDVAPKGVSLDGDALVVDAKINGPGPGEIVTEALTYPYAVIAAGTKDFETVRWNP